MPDYEIRILQSDGFPALITSETQLTDLAAIIIRQYPPITRESGIDNRG